MKTYKTIGFSNNKNHTEANASQQSSSKLEIVIHKEIQAMLDSNPPL